MHRVSVGAAFSDSSFKFAGCQIYFFDSSIISFLDFNEFDSQIYFLFDSKVYRLQFLIFTYCFQIGQSRD